MGGIPGTEMYGAEAAAAILCVCGNKLHDYAKTVGAKKSGVTDDTIEKLI